MSTRYNTGNPIESTDVRDMSDNAKNFDDFANSKSNEFTDRFGVKRKTIHGMNSQFDSHILNMGFTRVGTFATGATLTNPRQTLLWDVADGGDGQEYGWSGTFRKIVPPCSTPNTTGGIAVGAWRPVGDITLREELASPSGSDIVGFQQAGAGSIPRTSQDKMREIVSAPDFGSGIAAFNAAKVELGADPVLIPRGTFDIGANTPDFEVKGPGLIMANGVITGGNESSYNPELEIFSNTPKDYLREHLGITYPPPPFATDPGAQKRHRTVHSLGSQLGDPEKLAGYVTAFGNYNGANFNQWFAVDAFGGDTLMYAYNVERTVAVGSEALAWFGAPSYDYLVQFRHDWFRKPSSNPYLPGDPLWNPNGLATIFPTLSAEIGNFTGYATSTAGASYTTAVGRDAGNHTVAGTNNTLIGYGSGQNLFAGSRNTAVGTNSLQSPIFATQIAAFGTEAGRYCKDSIDAVFVGHAAGRTVQNASRSVFVGARAGDEVIDAEGSVVIGWQAGKGHSTLNNVLIIANDGVTKKPLISGEFTANVAGVSIAPDMIRARWHVRAGDSGSTLSPAAGILVEGVSQAAVTVETTNTGFSSYRFATPDGIYLGGMEYSPASNSITFKTNSISQVRIDGNGTFRPIVDNVTPLGSSSFRWSQLFAGAGTINTSDARDKSQPVAITDAMMDAADSIDIILYQWLSSIAEKGADNARWHFGAMAQAVRDAFAAQGLDGRDYGLLCYDEWEDEYEEHAAEYEEVPAVTQEVDGEIVEITTAHQRLVKEAYTVQTVAAGNRWGLRPDQCMWLLAAAARRRAERAEDRIRVIEEKISAAGW